MQALQVYKPNIFTNPVGHGCLLFHVRELAFDFELALSLRFRVGLELELMVELTLVLVSFGAGLVLVLLRESRRLADFTTCAGFLGTHVFGSWLFFLEIVVDGIV
jgi:hypothetical protein